LRSEYIRTYFNKTPEQITDEELKVVRKAYPFIVSEVPVKRD
jgi:hypothetical protein